jgi:hypothetical protein
MGLNCWASVLNDCGEGKSREHYISDGIFDSQTVTAFGLPWCRDKPVTIGMRSAVAKILCGKHNSDLSTYDAEAAKLSKFLVSNVLDDPIADATITLNGRHLEKWALKTLFNLGYIRGLHRNQPNRLEPPAHLVRHLFFNEPIADGVGIYFVTGTVSNHDFGPGVWWNAIQNPSNLADIYGMTLTFFGIRFVVSIPPHRAEQRIAAMGLVNDFDYASANILYRPPNIRLTSSTGGLKRIDLQW